MYSKLWLVFNRYTLQGRIIRSYSADRARQLATDDDQEWDSADGYEVEQLTECGRETIIHKFTS